LRNQESLTNLLEQLYDPTSPQYRHYLSSEQFAEKFGPTKQDYEAVIVYAKAQGLAVTATHSNRTLLDVSGSVADIERVFHVTMHTYQHPTESRTFHAPDVEPSFDLGVRVLHISGLDDFGRPHSMVRRKAPGVNRLGAGVGGSGPGGGFLGNDFRAAYVPGVALTGAGQSVALVEFDGYYTSDITNYESLAGLPNVPLRNVLIDGFDGAAGQLNLEVALDIEMAISMAPGLSSVIVYEGPLSTTFNDVFNRIATDNLARQISCSWYGLWNQANDQIFKQYAAQGQSFFEISGDFDAYPSSYLAATGWPGGIAPPTDNPYATIVGGTELNTSGPGGAWVSESVWNLGYFVGEPYSADSYSVGSSGGISPTYSIPSWQQGISMTANHGSTSQRNLPDVAMVADNIWLLCNNGDSLAVWGTSASTPLWAGFTALANQLAEAHGQPPVGFINPAIYALGSGASYSSTFHDITVGDNNSSSSRTGFPAVPGYDLCTGWGTPNGSNLLYALALPQFLQITPETSFTATGPIGGPFFDLTRPGFGPATQTYSLTNLGAVSLDWTLAYSASWLNASVTNGTIAPGVPATTVTLSLNAAANSLPLGNYTANVWFTNLNDGSVQSRQFDLAVQPGPQTPPIVVAQSTNQVVLDGGTATFTVEVTADSLPVAYQWTRNGIILTDGGNISGATTSTLTISNVSAAEVGSYSVFVANSIGAYHGSLAILTVASPPVIVVPPVGQVVLPGGTATFSVGAIGTKPFSYQWQNNGTNIISGGNTNVLTLHNVSAASAGAYSVVVSNVLGSVTNAEAMLSLIPVTAPGITLATLYSFTNGNDGANPNGLVQATNGNLYGTTISGGARSVGTAFRITTNGTLTTLHTFTGGSDGAAPKAGLIQAADGNFYGTTYSGGTGGVGTAFRMSVSGAVTTLHAFSGGSDGIYPFAGLVQATDSNLYGTASGGGDGGSGTIFKLTPNGILTPLHGFSGADGSSPRAGLVQANDGKLYGTTYSSAMSVIDGTVFRITTSGALNTLFNGTNSFSPRGGLVQGSDGNFYGTSVDDGPHGSGTVFRITPTGVLTTVYSFTGVSDGQFPIAALVEDKDGYFYGTTSYGGAYGNGTVFRMNRSGVLTTLLDFDGFNGANPAASLVQATDGSFYGTTLNGGANNDGTVFRLTVPVITSRLELTITPAGANITVSWPTNNAAGYHLQVTLDIGDPGGWGSFNLPAPPIIVNGNYVVTIPNTIATPHFFRLSQ
jgi:uncharacterized repeat protein (TIGR03803 family)